MRIFIVDTGIIGYGEPGYGDRYMDLTKQFYRTETKCGKYGNYYTLKVPEELVTLFMLKYSEFIIKEYKGEVY